MTTAPPTFDLARDREQLRLLAIFHYVVGAIAFLLASLFLIHVGLGITMLVAPEQMVSNSGEPAPAFVGWLMTAIGGGGVLAGWTLAACLVIAGRNLARHRRYQFCLVVAAVSCVFMPFGTVLGVFTILVLMRPTVKELFGVKDRLAS